MKLCEYADHKWSMDIEDGEVSLRCVDKHSDEEIEAMVEANDGGAPACAMIDYIDKLDINIYDIPISFNYYWQPGGYDYSLDGESIAEITILSPEAPSAAS
jgi:hypothetical protein